MWRISGSKPLTNDEATDPSGDGRPILREASSRATSTRTSPMSDRFRPLAFEQLVDWAATELEQRGSIFGVPRAAVFTPRPDHPFRARVLGVDLDTPWGVAAGPHTPAGPEHRRRLARRRPRHRAQDDPDARRARRQQALHRRHRRGLQRRVEPGAARPRVVRRVPPGLGPRPRAAPDARLPRRAAGRPLQHERRLQPRGDPPAERPVVPRRDGRRVGLAAGVRRRRRPALPGRPRGRDPGPPVRHDDALDDARLPAGRDRGDHPLPARGARPPHLGEVQPDAARARSGSAGS